MRLPMFHRRAGVALIPPLALGALLVGGCGARGSRSAPGYSLAERAPAGAGLTAPSPSDATKMAAQPEGGGYGGNAPASGAMGPLTAPGGGGNVLNAPGGGAMGPLTANVKLPSVTRAIPEFARKIIYTAEVDLVVESLTTAEQELVRLVKAERGYVAGNDVGGAPGTPRTGSWKVRVPVGRFEAFMTAVSRLGELQRIHRDSADVTEEYYDIGARLRNKQLEEARLLKHLERSTARLLEILAVENEVSRVRGEIEQMQGRLKLLTSQTELTTISITVSEVREYVAPRPTTLAAQVGRTFHDSAAALRDTCKAALLMLVSAAPWVAAVAVIVTPFWMLRRRRRMLAHRTAGQMVV